MVKKCYNNKSYIYYQFLNSKTLKKPGPESTLKECRKRIADLKLLAPIVLLSTPPFLAQAEQPQTIPLPMDEGTRYCKDIKP
jgi:hypothetical protein